jgi:hypothetical protein
MREGKKKTRNALQYLVRWVSVMNRPAASVAFSGLNGNPIAVDRVMGAPFWGNNTLRCQVELNILLGKTCQEMARLRPHDHRCNRHHILGPGVAGKMFQYRSASSGVTVSL